MLSKTLESPLDSEEIKPINPKGNHPEYSLAGLMLKLKLKLQCFGHLMQRANSLEKTLMYLFMKTLALRKPTHFFLWV